MTGRFVLTTRAQRFVAYGLLGWCAEILSRRGGPVGPQAG